MKKITNAKIRIMTKTKTILDSVIDLDNDNLSLDRTNFRGWIYLFEFLGELKSSCVVIQIKRCVPLDQFLQVSFVVDVVFQFQVAS